MKIPELQYKKGVFHFNERNLCGAKSVNEAEEIFKTSMLEVKRKKAKGDRVHSFWFNMWIQLGEYITYDCFKEFLEFVDLTEEDLQMMILSELKAIDNRHWKRSVKIRWKWYIDLKRRSQNE